MKQFINFKNSNTGFSMVEILISLVIVAVGMIGVGKLYASMITGTSESKNRFEAATLVESNLENLRYAYKVGDIANMNNQPTSKAGVTTNFTSSWEVIDLGQGQAQLVSITQWEDRNGNVTDDTTVRLSSIETDFQASLAAPQSAKADPVFDTGSGDCTVSHMGMGSSGRDCSTPTMMDTGSS